jgi:nitrogen fixation protein
VTYQKSYEETTIQVLITRVRGLKLDNTIRFPSGLVAPRGDGVVRDLHDGLIVWDTKVLGCQDRMSLMYQGHARLHQAVSTSHAKDDLEEAIILVAQKETKRYAGLVLEGTRSMCGHVCHNTQIPDVVACMEDNHPNKDWKFQKALYHDEANLLTHVHFLHLNRGLRNFQQFEDFQEAVCQVERKSLFNKLQALASGNK